MKKDILALDIGTTAFKFAVFDDELNKTLELSRSYSINLYDQGKADIEPEKWLTAFSACCEEAGTKLKNVGTISLSVNTPGLIPMADDGTALAPAMLFCDRRSNKQALEIRELVGEDKFLAETANLPVTGGSSLCSILWIKENMPDVWNATVKFGHTNTFMSKHLTGNWAIDPSTTSITGLYNTVKNDLTWNVDVLEKAGINENLLPPLMQSYDTVGNIKPEIAEKYGLPKECKVLCGGNDAVLGAMSAGLNDSGDVVDMAGTCEIIMTCLDNPASSTDYNIRCHVLPNRWVGFFVLNTGGKSLEWFKSVFCPEMPEKEFYKVYISKVINSYLKGEIPENDLPVFEPYLQGSRYTLENLTGSFSNLTLETTREKMLLGLLKGNMSYLGNHIDDISNVTKLGNKIITSGGGAKINGMNELKKHWLGDFEYTYYDQSSLLGAAMLAKIKQ